ncbi:MAG: hypothetical protein JWQ63_4083 [Mucilaginibacter sp.]|nr:hypothetical protein [Mucilaginibacter sp.]
MIVFKYLLYIMLMVFMISCKKPYNPPAITAPGSYLVVEGVINAGSDSTVIKLSKTVNLSGAVTTNPVLQASVTVESDQNISFPLTEAYKGNYVSAGLNLDNTRKYRVSIKTSDGKTYLSDFEPVINTPPIDSLNFKVQNSSIQVYVSTHDPGNNIKYYRWDYQEAWQFHAQYQSQYITNGTAIVPRTAAQSIYYCYGRDSSSTILIGSSAKLMKDVIYQNPLTQIASTSEKLELEYGMQVNQYALTGAAYNFWVNLKKNTEQLGSIFDAQPSQINGNIRCVTNPSEPVIGYISISTVGHKTVFISNAQLPQSWKPAYPYTSELDSALYCHYRDCQNDVVDFLIPLGSTEIPVSAITKGPGTIGYLASTQYCTDCTIRGIKTPPAFWK